MRVSGLGKFRKLYGVLDMSLAAGRKLQLRANSQFPANEFDATKSIVLMTQQWTGEPQTGAGIVLLLGAGFCFALGCFFLFLVFSKPHHLATIQYLDWAG